MTEKQDEWLSKWFDGDGSEFEQRRAVDLIAEDPLLSEKLSRYQLIRDSLTNQLPHGVAPDFAASISAKIANENIQPDISHSHASVGKWLRPFAGVAVAATVATIAIFTMQPGQQVANSSLTASAPVVNQTLAVNDISPIGVTAQTVSAGSNPQYKFSSVIPQGEMMSMVGPDHNRQWNQLDPSLKQALGRYIMDHHSGQFQQPVPNVLPSVRLVGFSEVQ